MVGKYYISVLMEVDSILLAVSLLSILFFFFYVKVKFQKKASLKSYGILFYAFVFYTIASISYVLLNALDNFLRLDNDIYAGYGWFIPVVVTASLFGAFCGLLIYVTASKIAAPYAYKMLNLSLFVIAPVLVFTLLFKPFNQTLNLIIPTGSAELMKSKEINSINLKPLKEKPNEIFFPASPAIYNDSLDISIVSGQMIQVRCKQNGYLYTHRIPFANLQTLYTSEINSPRLFAILALGLPLEKKSAVVVFDSIGNCVYQKIFDSYINRMSLSKSQRFLLFQNEEIPDSLVFKFCLQIK